MQWDQIEQLTAKEHQLEMSWWASHTLFSTNWWIITAVNVLCFLLFIVFIDRNRKNQIIIGFMIAFTIVGIVDETGKYFGFWTYPYEFIQFLERFNAVNFFVIPCLFTLIYQWFTKWLNYLVATLGLALVNSYIGEPLFVALGIYRMNTWTYTRSFLTMLVMGIIIKSLTDLLVVNSGIEKLDRELHFPLRRKTKI
ncbi:CBO0543 family protein [Paenibacillus aestuarii]|uniref:CBO0543 family protein n=1 Tax=Paenibacillus aestuarii TaxID=516965 RepID=A0ABW0KCG6_9BACL|nr:CBO0543 family protein [Paenibacillus aestuarii]